MDNILEQSLLFDFYGELLTNHQKQIYEEYVSEDLTLSEIAEQHGISRQGVHDLIRRCGKTLSGYEEKLHLLERFLLIKKKVNQIKEATADLERDQDPENLKRIEQISNEILEEL